jgi:osmoprotectant transport system ATP-binding protein
LKPADTAHSEGPSAFAQAAELELRSVSKRYEGQQRAAIEELSLTVPAGEVCVLVGPSGSGKTTAMRLINRMIGVTSGDILLGGRSVLARDPRELRREIGYVIQQIGLFPHRTVNENIATVPRLLGWRSERIRARVHELLELIGLDPGEMGERYPSQLSGGQRQRVGVARALAADPPLMLMDEPFGAIDPINRSRLQDEFLRLQQQVKKTVVFVTHDIDEAIKMGDRIAILREGGRLAQYDTPGAILAAPADEFVDRFVGADRGIKRLSLITLADLGPMNGHGARDGAGADAEPAAGGADARASANGARGVPVTTPVRDALSKLLTNEGAPLVVLAEDGSARGTLTLDLLQRRLREYDGALADAGAGAGERPAPRPAAAPVGDTAVAEGTL